jgi:putative transposase
VGNENPHGSEPWRGDIMSRTFTNLLTHLVFSTKNREPLVVPDLKSELYAYLGGLTRELKGKAYSIGGYDDHVHM